MEYQSILSKLIAYKTDGDENGINNCLRFVQKTLNKKGWETALVKNYENNKNNLIAVLNGNLNNINDGIILAGHIDTVTTDERNWCSNPFSLTSSNGEYCGLGVADMKNFTAAILANLENISNLNTNKPIMLALTNDEETLMFGIKSVIEFLKQNKIFPKFAIIGEPSNMDFGNSNKGFYEFETVINGKAAHSSEPSVGINAVYIMSKIISFIEKLNKKYINDGTTINVGIINGGTMCNIVPEKCIIRWDVRTLQKKHLNQINNSVIKYLDKLLKDYNGATYTNEIVFKIPPFEYKQNLIVENLKNILEIKEFPYSAATEAGFYQELGINCVIFGCGNIKDCHSVNEKIKIEDFETYQKKLLKIIKEFCK